MIKQHRRRYNRTAGSMVIYYAAVAFFSRIIILNLDAKIIFRIIFILVLVLLGIIAIYVELSKDTFNKVIFTDERIEIKNIINSRNIYWNEITSIRLLCEEYQVGNGLEERHYGIYYIKDNIEKKETISFNDIVDKEIRKHYKSN